MSPRLFPTSLFARVCIGLVAIVAGGCDHFRSFESVCEERVASTQIRVDAAPVAYAADFSRSYDDLAAKDGRSSNLTTLGLVTADMKATVEYTANGITQRRTGRHCMRPSVHVKLAYSPMTLYVSREQPRARVRSSSRWSTN